MKLYAFDMIPANLLKPSTREFTVEHRQVVSQDYGADYFKFVKTMVTVQDDPEDIGKNLSAGCLWYCVNMREVLSWTVTAKVEPIYQTYGMKGKAVNENHGVLLVGDSKSAMIKGLKKIYDMKGSESGYLIDSYKGMGVACANLTVPATSGTSSIFGAIASTLAHNAKERLKRAAIKTAYKMMPEAYQKTFMKWVNNNVTADHMGSVSSAVNLVKSSNKLTSLGYAVYVAPSEVLPTVGNNGYVRRLIGDSVNLGTIASILQRSEDDSKRQGGIFN